MAVDKNTKQIKAMFREAFDNLGGVEFLVTFAKKSDSNARVFVQAVAKLIPQELTGKDGMPLTIRVISQAEGELGGEGRIIELGPDAVRQIQ